MQTLGSSSGQELDAAGHDKFATWQVGHFPGEQVAAPLIEGCVAWLECRLLPEAHIQQGYDLFLGEVIAAQADSRVFSEGRWHFDGQDDLRTLHHVAGGHYLVIGEGVDGKALLSGE